MYGVFSALQSADRLDFLLYRASRTNSTVNIPGLNNESDPEGQTALAILAGGPYGVADIAGALNRSLVMRSCRDDGVLL